MHKYIYIYLYFLYIYISYISFYSYPKYIIRQAFYRSILVSEKADAVCSDAFAERRQRWSLSIAETTTDLSETINCFIENDKQVRRKRQYNNTYIYISIYVYICIYTYI